MSVFSLITRLNDAMRSFEPECYVSCGELCCSACGWDDTIDALKEGRKYALFYTEQARHNCLTKGTDLFLQWGELRGDDEDKETPEDEENPNELTASDRSFLGRVHRRLSTALGSTSVTLPTNRRETIKISFYNFRLSEEVGNVRAAADLVNIAVHHETATDTDIKQLYSERWKNAVTNIPRRRMTGVKRAIRTLMEPLYIARKRRFNAPEVNEQ